MFIRRKVVKGVTYCQVVETYRVKDKVCQKVILSLGRCNCSTLEGAIQHARKQVKRQWDRAYLTPSSWQRGDARWLAEYRAKRTEKAILRMEHAKSSAKRKLAIGTTKRAGK